MTTTTKGNTMTAKEKAQAIRTELKAHGISSRQVSVRSSETTISDSVTLRVRDLDVSIDLLQSISRKHEEVARDQFGNILGGGNTYVSIRTENGTILA